MKLIIFSAAAAAIAFATVAQANNIDNTYFWLHPKLGIVRVDKTTNAMVTTAHPMEKQEKEATTILWIGPRGNVRRIPKPVPAPKP